MPRFMTDHLRNPKRATPHVKPRPSSGNVIRQGKSEEGEAHGEGWAVVRAMVVVVAGLALITYFVS